VLFGGSGFDLAVNLCTYEEHEAGDVKPGEEDDHCAEGAIGDGVIV